MMDAYDLFCARDDAEERCMDAEDLMMLTFNLRTGAWGSVAFQLSPQTVSEFTVVKRGESLVPGDQFLYRAGDVERVYTYLGSGVVEFVSPLGEQGYEMLFTIREFFIVKPATADWRATPAQVWEVRQRVAGKLVDDLEDLVEQMNGG